MDTATLSEYLGHQRWFAGKGRTWQVVDVRPMSWLRRERPAVRVELATVEYAEGDRETYQVPLVYRDDLPDHLTHALVGEVVGDDGVTWACDALHDKEVTGLWIGGIAEGRDLGDIVFHREPSTPEIALDAHSIVVGAEQSNTSLVYGDALILKVFRRPLPGLNPDIEIHSALHRAGNQHIATPLGWMEGRWTTETGEEVSGGLAMLQEFLRSATEGWDLAKASVRDLFAEGDLHADEVGGDFAAEAHRLGAATAEVHADLARSLPTAALDHDGVGTLVAGMRAGLATATAAVPEIRPYVDALAGAYDDLASTHEPIHVQRIHGDFHLGQVMRDLTGWKLIDFEGEPVRSLAERRALASPLKDVAGMLRSFDYASRHLLADHRGEPQLEYRAAEWAERNRDAFCDGYAESSGRHPYDEAVLLRALEIEKAVYEVVYEVRHRPAWLPIPLAAVERLAQSQAEAHHS